MTSRRDSTVRAWMSEDVVVVRPEVTLHEAIRIMQDREIRRLPVVDENGNLIGLITETDVRGVAPFSGRDRPLPDIQAILEGFEVHEQMSKNPVTISPDRHLSQAVRYFLKGKFGALPVLSGGELVGILTETDVLRAFLEQLEADEQDQDDGADHQ